MKLEGVGFGVYGPEESYLVLVNDDGTTESVSAHQLVPSACRVPWPFYEALTGGFGDRSAVVLLRERAYHDEPRAYRLRITVEEEALTYEETRELLARVKRANESR